MITFEHKGDLTKTSNFFRALQNKKLNLEILEKFGDEGIRALREATPVQTGKTAASWYYVIIESKDGLRIEWRNSNVVDGVPIAIILQYGHATGNGGYVEGRDYINPAIQPIFDRIADNVWKEVKRL